jgi:hypothetical protein
MAVKCAAFAAAVGLTACHPSAPPSEDLGEAKAAQFANGGFEVGAAGAVPPSWTLTEYLNPNPNGVTIQTTQTLAGLNLVSGSVGACATQANCPAVGEYGTCAAGMCKSTAHTLLLNSAAGALSQSDPTLGATASLRWPRYGNQCALVNQLASLSNVNALTQTMTIGAADVDPTDGQIHVRFAVAPVLEDPGHAANQQPYFYVQITNVTRANAVLYSTFNFSNQAGVPWQTVTTGGNTYRYTDWQLIDVSPGSPGINMGDVIQADFIAAGCSIGGHWGELYVDGSTTGAVLPGLFVSGSGPAQANANTNITYNLTYKNGSPSVACVTAANCQPNTESCVAGFCAENGVVIDFTTPPNTVYEGMTPPAGATCVTPAVGAAGTIVCTFTNPVGPGASGSLSVTVKINPLTACTTSAMCPAGINCVNGFCDIGSIVCGTYDIHSTQETTLLGNKVVTTLGCVLDTDCPAGAWCDESVAQCTPTLANGAAIPKDPPHTAPTLNGTCAAAGAGALVCTSKVCDTDNLCGWKNGDGVCTSGTGPVVCRSGVCDPDGKCGYANGDGPCVPGPASSGGNGLVVCRSGVCSNSGVCEALGTCDVDSDCTGGNWCLESTHTCTPKLANGGPIPTDPTHMSPTLNGMCTAAAATLVCQSGACDTKDNDCGYANGDGPCASGTVCRSTACSVNGLCEPLGGCNVDADCSGGNWCLESTHTCTPRLGNGTALPSDPTHTGPTLNGMCTAGAAALVCVSGVCDTDNKCGLLNGDGACTPGAAGNGSVVCRSAVCDPDMKCGYANGDGPCVPGAAGNGAVVCRSTACSTGGVCEPLNGCELDADCSGGNWCNESAQTCTPRLANGIQVPTDSGHVAPQTVLNGTCTVAAGALTCVSGVCDTHDNECGYANGDGPCTVANGPTVCRSGACTAVSGVCEPVGGCNVDADCTGGNWCDESAHVCTPRLANGVAVPTDGPHTNPTLNGTCTAAAGALTCVSLVCDSTDDKCGYANGDGPCTVATGPTVCRSGSCTTTSGVCAPSGGCSVDADCASGNWCNETAHMCTPQLANGVAVPTDGPHTSPTLNGMCTAAAGTLVCQSGVCDTKDNECGYANGDGPCTAANGGLVCRSATCSTNGTCEPSGGCNVDADCTIGKWCDETMSACLPTLPNGTVVPTDGPHTNPTLNGTCTAAAGALTCTSGVCDTKDNECGYANGDGPCTASNGSTVCRSGKCGATGVCAGCTMDSDCGGATPVCNTTTGICVQCTTSAMCSGATPVCDAATSTCVPCNGDNGSTASDPCSTTAHPFCFVSGAMTGACGKCAADSDCPTGKVCNTTSGLCVAGCFQDSECASGQWCNSPAAGTAGTCVPKLANGTPLPATPSSVATCTSAVGARVCVSGVCDKDNACGLANGDGPCTDPNVCRTDMCDSAKMVCGAPGCAGDSDCPAADYCAATGTCTPKGPLGATCAGNNQCQSADCVGSVCSAIVGSGNGLTCAARPGNDTTRDEGGAMFGLMLAAAGLARRRRR